MDGVTTARVAARRPNDDAAAVRASASQPLRAGLASQKERVDKATAELVRKHRANNAATKRAPRTGTQKALDAYLAQARATYTLGGRTVRVLPGFRMVSKGGQIGPTPAAAHRRVREALPKPALARVAPFLGRVVTGKASPEQVRRVTQALIDAGKLPPRGSDRAAIRQLQFDHGIGLDCSGYAFKAFHQMRGTREAQPGHLPSGTRRFDDPKALRPGDLVVLQGRSAGHKVIVSSHTVLAPGARGYSGIDGAIGRSSFFERGPVHVYEVDSSWGNNGEPNVGGVERHTWLFNEASRRWAYFNHYDGGRFVTAPSPYGEHLVGFYRDRSRAERRPASSRLPSD